MLNMTAADGGRIGTSQRGSTFIKSIDIAQVEP